MNEDMIKKYIEIERSQHPWAETDILRRIVEDELAADPEYYEEAGDEDEAEVEGETEDDEQESEDPFAEEKEDKKPANGMKEKKPSIIIAIGEHKDPFPKE
jgi:hypothetical protein